MTVAATAATTVPENIRTTLLRAYLPLLVAAAGYYAAATLILGDTRVELSDEIVGIFFNLKLMLLPFVVLMPIYAYGYLVLTGNGERPFVRIGRWLRQVPFAEIALLRFLPMVLVLGLVQISYAAFKRSIPDLAPYSWDPVLAEFDRTLFLGVDPWIFTHWAFPSPQTTYAIGMAYGLWLMVILAGFGAASCMRLDSQLRMTFHLSFVLCWGLGGSLLAAAFSSAGPVYVERLFGDPTFDPLMQRLAAQSEVLPVFALEVQEMLWRGFADPDYPAMGISAFPSMHLCSSAVVMLLGFGVSRILGCCLALFLAVMLIGSVHLGWHYAVDGIAGIGLAFLFWWLARLFTSWWFERATQRRMVLPAAPAR